MALKMPRDSLSLRAESRPANAPSTDGEPRDMRHEINNLAIRVLGRTLFAADMDSPADTVYNAMHDISEILVEHINLPLPTPRWWPSKSNRRKIDAIEAIERASVPAMPVATPVVVVVPEPVDDSGLVQPVRIPRSGASARVQRGRAIAGG